jgi:hypothetical protein
MQSRKRSIIALQQQHRCDPKRLKVICKNKISQSYIQLLNNATPSTVEYLSYLNSPIKPIKKKLNASSA